MSDWAPGDLALCVDGAAKPWNDALQLATLSRLAVGRIYRVKRIGRDGTLSGPTIMLEGCPACYEERGLGWTASRFRKIRPDEHEACEPEFAVLLRRSKQKEPAQ